VTAAALRRDPGNAFNALATRARRASPASLVALETAGLFAALVVWAFFPARWQYALPLLAFSALGLWGVIDKMIASRGRQIDPLVEAVLRGLQLLVAVAGVTAATIAGYLIIGGAIGTVVS
jgi:hypothetical protein